MSELFRRKISKDQSRDTGMAMVLLLMILAISPRHHRLLLFAMVLHVLNMIVPAMYKPVAFLWFGLSDLMGAVMSKVSLALVFFLVVTPIGALRRLFGKDSLQLRAFKAGKDSALRERNHTFTAHDLESPF